MATTRHVAASQHPMYHDPSPLVSANHELAHASQAAYVQPLPAGRMSSPLENVPDLSLAFDMAADMSATLNSTMPPPVTSPNKSGQTLRSSPPAECMVLGEQTTVAIPPPALAPATTDSPIKRPLHASVYGPLTPFQNMVPMTQPSSTAIYANMGLPSSEAALPPYHSDNFAEFSAAMSTPVHQPPYARHKALPDGPSPPAQPGTLRNRADEKAAHVSSQAAAPPSEVVIPEPEDMPLPEDDGTKPPYSYAALIGMSILRAPNRRLTLAQIYRWISNTFSFYRTADTGWQNSIRHNLSLHKEFIKKERPKDDPGKGNYWAIEPGMEITFLREKPTRRPAANSSQSHARQSSASINAGTLHAATPQSQSQPSVRHSATAHPSSQAGPSCNGPLSSGSPAVVGLQTSDATISEQGNGEPSSEATIPASDPALLDEDDAVAAARRAALSSPLATIHSSPPIAARSRDATPPRGYATGGAAVPSAVATDDALLGASLSDSRGTKRKRNTMQDSGYFSSLESSALRQGSIALPPHRVGGIASSDWDARPSTFAGGRAEEELQRIRHRSTSMSSAIAPHDPSPSRAARLPQPLPPVWSSSPLREVSEQGRAGESPARRMTDELLRLGPQEDVGSMLPPPFTPAVTFKRPRRPPPSISPNTNLRNHRNRIRELIGSPLRIQRGVGGSESNGTSLTHGLTEDDDHASLGFSPAFRITEDHLDLSEHRPIPEASFSIFADDTATSSFLSPLAAWRGAGSPEKRSVPPRPRTALGQVTPSKAPTQLDASSANSDALLDITSLASNAAHLPPSMAASLREQSQPNPRLFDRSKINLDVECSPTFSPLSFTPLHGLPLPSQGRFGSGSASLFGSPLRRMTPSEKEPTDAREKQSPLQYMSRGAATGVFPAASRRFSPQPSPSKRASVVSSIGGLAAADAALFGSVSEFAAHDALFGLDLFAHAEPAAAVTIQATAPHDNTFSDGPGGLDLLGGFRALGSAAPAPVGKDASSKLAVSNRRCPPPPENSKATGLTNWMTGKENMPMGPPTSSAKLGLAPSGEPRRINTTKSNAIRPPLGSRSATARF